MDTKRHFRGTVSARILRSSRRVSRTAPQADSLFPFPSGWRSPFARVHERDRRPGAPVPPDPFPRFHEDRLSAAWAPSAKPCDNPFFVAERATPEDFARGAKSVSRRRPAPLYAGQTQTGAVRLPRRVRDLPCLLACDRYAIADRFPPTLGQDRTAGDTERRHFFGCDGAARAERRQSARVSSPE